MSKYKFETAERFAIWNSHKNTCFWCGEPIKYSDTTIDHVLPETLLDNPDEFNRVKINYDLPDDFQINDFCNWVPSHSNCNARKSKKVFRNSPAFIFVLERLYSKSENTKKYYEKLKKQQDKDKLTAQLLTNLELGKLDENDLITLLRSTTSKYAWQFPIIDKDKLYFVPEGWHVMSENENKHFLTITNGTTVATVPSDKKPDNTWYCYSCHDFTPWNGNICTSCGRWGDLVD